MLSAQNLSCFVQRRYELVHFTSRVVEREGGARGGGDVETLHQHLRAMMSGAHRHAFTVQYGGEVVRMHAFGLERQDRTLARRAADDADPVEVFDGRRRVIEQIVLMGGDGCAIER